MKRTSISLSGKDKINLISNLSTMLKAGIPIFEAVDSLLDDAKGSQAKLLKELRDDLKGGNYISATFAKFPNVFDTVTVNLIKASEEAGSLEQTLADVRDTIQKEMEFTDKVRGALIYPLFISLVFVGVMLMILLVVIPKISTVFLRLRVELPGPTKAMIWLSNALIHNTWLVVGVVVVVSVVVFLFFKYQRRAIVGTLLKLPVVSGLALQIDLTRFARSLHLLLSSGMPIAQALELAEEVVNRPDVQKIIAHSREKVVSGSRFAEGLTAKKEVIPSMFIKLIEVGERSGTLDTAMKDIAEKLDYEVSKNLKSATAMIEPIMLVLVGGAVGLMMMAIIAPIYGLISSVGAR
jgi:type II secretory pathway component PulF